MLHRIFKRKQKSLYKVEVNIIVKNVDTFKTSITTSAYSKRKAIERVKEEVEFSIGKAHKIKNNHNGKKR